MSEKEKIAFLHFYSVKIKACPINEFVIVLIHNLINYYDKIII